jgi:aminopeptidase
MASAQSAQQNFDTLAKRVVATTVKVKPGNVVAVMGGKHTIPFMEALSIEAAKAGGMVTMFLDTDRVERAFFTEVPEQYLDQQPQYFVDWLKHVDVWIGLPGVENSKAVFGDIPEKRFARAVKAGDVVTNALNSLPVRAAFIGYPSREDAQTSHVDFAALEKMHWAAVNANYEQIAQAGKRLRGLLKDATVHVASPSGTDLRFTIGDRRVFVDDGLLTEDRSKSKLALERFVSLPGGRVFVAPVESSANGKVVVPKSQCRYQPFNNVSFEFRKGKLENFKAGQGGQCFEQAIAPYTGSKETISTFSIGLNPALHVIENPGDYRPAEAAGMVWVLIGDNRLLGGNNQTDASFGFPIVNATVEINGKVVVKRGKLVM